MALYLGDSKVQLVLDNSNDYLAKVINGEITTLVNDKITKIFPTFQKNNKDLTYVNLPNIINIPESAFMDCTKLEGVNFPNVTTISGGGCFERCVLEEFYLPELVSITGWGYVFSGCTTLKKVKFPKLTGQLTVHFFSGCPLTTLILGANTVCTIADINALYNTPILNGEGYIYVPSSVIEDYKVAEIWSTLADKFRPTCIDDIVGQEHILGKGKVLRRLIENKNVSNLIRNISNLI